MTINLKAIRAAAEADKGQDRAFILLSVDILALLDRLEAAEKALAEPAVEPFGYFRAEPFGWTDCAPTDEGAKALYEVPPPAEPAPVPWLSEEEIGRIFLKFEGSLQSLRDCANEIEKAYRRKAGL